MALVIPLALVVLFAFAVANLRRTRETRRAAAETVKLEADDWGVKRWLADGRYEEVAWAEVIEVRMITLPKGPWDDRVRLVIDGGGERGCIVPFEIAEESDLLASFSHLKGFDHRAMADALEQTRTGTHVLWERTTT